jgi:hypothetical protein
MARAVKTAIGDTTQEDNPFGWVRIHENYPCTPDYDASLPWLMKIRSDGKIACDKVVYVDDGRIVGPTKEAGRQAMRKLCSGLSHLGVQDAVRKRRPVGQKATGAWAGTLAKADGIKLVKLTLQEKWDRGKSGVAWIEGEIETHGDIDSDRLRGTTGFLMHLAQTYHPVRPFLKGFYFTLESWRPDRDDQGYRDPSFKLQFRRRGDDDEGYEYMT